MLNPDGCNATTDLYDANNVFIKSVCVISSQSITYPTAVQQCAKLGMYLFTIDSADSQSSLKKYVASAFSSNGNSFWVNGVYDNTDSQWYVNNSSQASLYSGVTWAKSMASGCLLVALANGEFKVQGNSCLSTRSAFCEYNSRE